MAIFSSGQAGSSVTLLCQGFRQDFDSISKLATLPHGNGRYHEDSHQQQGDAHLSELTRMRDFH
jgi:hypothetical protein